MSINSITKKTNINNTIQTGGGIMFSIWVYYYLTFRNPSKKSNTPAIRERKKICLSKVGMSKEKMTAEQCMTHNRT
jgi:hypothetical protein